jgi:hypothetical protein
MRIKTKNIVIAAFATTATSMAFAVAPGFYMGGDFGVSNLHNKTQTIKLDPFGKEDSYTASNEGLGIRIFMGGSFNQYGAIEGGFSHYASTTYGSVPYTGYMVNPVTGTGLVATTSVTTKPAIHEYGFDLEGKGMYPLGPITIFGKAGFAFVRSSSSGILATCSGNATVNTPCSLTASVTSSAQSNAFRPLVAIGGSYDLSQSWVMDVSATRITKGSGIENLDFFSIGFSYHIVDTYCGQFLC